MGGDESRWEVMKKVGGGRRLCEEVGGEKRRWEEVGGGGRW